MLGDLQEAETPVHLSRELQNADAPKRTVDFYYAGRIVDNAADLRQCLREGGVDVEEWKKLPSYTEARMSGDYPWLAEL